MNATTTAFVPNVAPSDVERVRALKRKRATLHMAMLQAIESDAPADAFRALARKLDMVNEHLIGLGAVPGYVL